MRTYFRQFFVVLSTCIITFPYLTSTAQASLPVPRFVTLKSNEANARTGPSTQSPVKWVYTQKGLPMEITAEFDQWRRVQDITGEVGWMHQSLLSGRRNAITHTADKSNVTLYDDNDATSADTIAFIEPSTMVTIDECDEKWCYIFVSDYAGWVDKTQLWGVYKEEIID